MWTSFLTESYCDGENNANFDFDHDIETYNYAYDDALVWEGEMNDFERDPFYALDTAEKNDLLFPERSTYRLLRMGLLKKSKISSAYPFETVHFEVKGASVAHFQFLFGHRMRSHITKFQQGELFRTWGERKGLLQAVYMKGKVGEKLVTDLIYVGVSEEICLRAFFLSAEVGNAHCLEELYKLLEPTMTNLNVSKALSLAEKNGRTEAFNFLFSLNRTTLLDELKIAKAAAKRGHVKIVNEHYLSQTSFRLDLQDKSGTSALMLAASMKDVHLLKALTKNGASLDLQDQTGMTALMYSIREGINTYVDYIDAIFSCVKILLESGSNVNIPNRAGYTALMFAVSVGCHLNLLHDTECPFGRLALKSAQTEYLKITRALIAAGAKVDAQSTKGLTALMCASKLYFVEAVELLVDSKACLHLADTEQSTALMHAIVSKSPNEEDQLQVVKLLADAGAQINACNKKGDPALILAAKSSSFLSPKILVFLIERKANIEVANLAGDSPLKAASKTSNIEKIKLLLSFRANIDAPYFGDKEQWDYNCATALMQAAINGHSLAVKELIRAGADIHFQARGAHSPTALFYAAMSGRLDTVSKLLKAGAKADLIVLDSLVFLSTLASRDCVEMPLDVLCFVFKDCCKLERDSQKNAGRDSSRAALLRCLISARASVHFRNEYGITALALATVTGSAQCVDILIAAGAVADLNYDGTHFKLFAGPRALPLKALGPKNLEQTQEKR